MQVKKKLMQGDFPESSFPTRVIKDQDIETNNNLVANNSKAYKFLRI